MNIHKTYIEAFHNMRPSGSRWLGWFGHIVIVAGGLIAYFVHPAWLALSVLGLAWALEGQDMNTRTSVAAIVLCLEDIAQYLETEREP